MSRRFSSEKLFSKEKLKRWVYLAVAALGLAVLSPVSAEGPRQETRPLRPTFEAALDETLTGYAGQEVTLGFEQYSNPLPGTADAYKTNVYGLNGDLIDNLVIDPTDFAQKLFAEINGENAPTTSESMPLSQAIPELFAGLDRIGEASIVTDPRTGASAIIERSSLTAGRPKFTLAGVFNQPPADEAQGFNAPLYPEGTVAVERFSLEGDPESLRMFLGAETLADQVVVTTVDDIR